MCFCLKKEKLYIRVNVTIPNPDIHVGISLFTRELCEILNIKSAFNVKKRNSRVIFVHA